MTPIEQAAKILSSAWKGVAFTGAGISAASGISTYRDTGGLWDRFGSEDIFNVLAEHPDKAHEIIESFFSALEKARPNPAHLALGQTRRNGPPCSRHHPERGQSPPRSRKQVCLRIAREPLSASLYDLWEETRTVTGVTL